MRYHLWAWHHRQRLCEFLNSRTARELTEQQALEEIVGPLGEERQDRRIAWLVYWIVTALGNTKDLTATDFLASFLQWLRDEREESKPDELIIDDPDASARKAAELEKKLLAVFPRD